MNLMGAERMVNQVYYTQCNICHSLLISFDSPHPQIRRRWWCKHQRKQSEGSYVLLKEIITPEVWKTL